MSEKPVYLTQLCYEGLVDLLEIPVEKINIRDIAHALARVCRYGGHVRDYYSVAEHSLAVSHEVEKRSTPGAEARAAALCGLLHDATEAYLGDVVSGLKRRPEFAFYREQEARMASKIANRFNLSPDSRVWELVDRVDKDICGTEMRQQLQRALRSNGEALPPSFPGLVVGVMSPQEAETRFLARFQELTCV